jgi:molybdenum ABC transporter molybdate-binding protein
LWLPGCQQETKKADPDLLLYCAAGMKGPMEEIVHQYKAETGVNVVVQYGGSGTLLSSIRASKIGDLYLAADEGFLESARKFNLVEESQFLATLKPVILTQKGNPRNIHSILDFLDKDVTYCLGSPEAASIGKIVKKLMEKQNRWKEMEAKAKVFKPTVFDIANDVKIKAVDAGIVFDAVALQYPDLDIVHDTLLDQMQEKVSVSVLKSSSQPTEALRFLRYVSARDKGLQIFQKFKYSVKEGDVWSPKPELVLLVGGLNRISSEGILRQFEEREGISINRVYNGCGILVSQIKSGKKPDAYYTCDTSFMSQVKNDFTDIRNVSQTEIVIATQKGNPKNIKELADLKTQSVKIGVCNPEQSALGALTQRMFSNLKLEDINKNVVVQTPTADLLVNQLRTGALDVAILYRANATHVKEKLEIIPIKNTSSIATQNIGISTASKNRNLMLRLMSTIKSKGAEGNFTNNGFTLKD